MNTCYVFGSNATTIECCEKLAQNNYKIKAIITSAKSVCKWSENNNVTVFSTIEGFKDSNPRLVDFIFSIVNEHILDSKILQLAKINAINYHNSLLPQDAGVNSNFWAIIRRYKTTGVTWHEMSDMFDGGNILKQIEFDIEELDTVATLGLKSHKYAVESFMSLIKVNFGNKGKKQDLSNRTANLTTDYPPDYGIINLRQPINVIMSSIRSRNFGHFIESPYGFMKLYYDSNWYIIKEANTINPNDASNIINLKDGILYLKNVVSLGEENLPPVIDYKDPLLNLDAYLRKEHIKFWKLFYRKSNKFKKYFRKYKISNELANNRRNYKIKVNNYTFSQMLEKWFKYGFDDAVQSNYAILKPIHPSISKLWGNIFPLQGTKIKHQLDSILDLTLYPFDSDYGKWVNSSFSFIFSMDNNVFTISALNSSKDLDLEIESFSNSLQA